MRVEIKSDPRVQQHFQTYPKKVFEKMQFLRDLIFETADETKEIQYIEETLKWGEPSYITKHGSTLRIDWKQKTPDQYAMYFKCTSKLVPSFKEVFQDNFRFQKDRAIEFNLHQTIPVIELKKCIKAALTYHKVKHLPMLGIDSKMD